MNQREPAVVIVNIAGEEYTLRAQASPEYTRQCADYLDTIIRDIRKQAGGLQGERLAILAGLALADQLFQARAAGAATQTDILESIAQLRAEIEARLGPPDLAASS
jgi:cell division protein ZapA (FtsZ GTPase activity inhibitor)